MNKGKLVLLRSFTTLIDAQIALDHLASNGVEGMIKKDDSGGMRPHFQLTIGVDIIVLEKDFEKAEEILKAMNV